MHEHVILNRRLLEARRARLHAVTSAALYGRGVFTTVAVHKGRPFLWDAHWARLLAHLIEANGVEEGRARVHLLARPLRARWKMGNEERASDLLMMTADAWESPESLALTVSPYRVNTCSPLVGVKTVNRLEQIRAWEEAKGRDFDEAVVCNERGEIACATTANLFWVKHGTVYTPALATGAVAGTTRARVIELAAELAVPLSEGAHTLHDMADADEVFLTSAALGVALVTTFDYHRYTVHVGSPALRLREAYRQLTLNPEPPPPMPEQSRGPE